MFFFSLTLPFSIISLSFPFRFFSQSLVSRFVLTHCFIVGVLVGGNMWGWTMDATLTAYAYDPLGVRRVRGVQAREASFLALSGKDRGGRGP